MDEATLAGIEQHAAEIREMGAAVRGLGLAEMERRAEAATEGPWTIDGEHHAGHMIGAYIRPPNGRRVAYIGADEDVAYVASTYADAEFIAHAREDIPQLVAEVRRLSAALAEATDVYTLRERGLRVLGEEQCCELACDGGACETCPCCCAGWCVAGHNGEIPDPVNDAENYAIWLEIAAEHNPVAKRLAEVSAALAEQQRRAAAAEAERDELAKRMYALPAEGPQIRQRAIEDPTLPAGQATGFEWGWLRAMEAVSAALAAAPSGEPKACPDCESDDRNMRGIIPVPSGGRWGYREQECESEWHDSSAAPSGEQRKEGKR